METDRTQRLANVALQATSAAAMATASTLLEHAVLGVLADLVGDVAEQTIAIQVAATVVRMEIIASLAIFASGLCPRTV